MAIVIVAGLTVTGASAQTQPQQPDQYQLRVSSQPNVVFIGGGGVYNAGTIVTLDKAPEFFQDYTFLGWKVDGIWASGNPITIRMDRSHSADAIYEKSATEKIKVDAIPRVAEITIDGEIYLPDELPATFDWASGSEHIISVPKIVAETPTTRYVFDSWKDQDDSVLRTVTVSDEKEDFIALFKTQHYLKPITEYGVTIGGGWKDEGSTVQFGLESEYALDKKNENIRYVFNSWNLGDYSNKLENSIDVIQPTTVEANWDVEYRLKVKSNVPDYEPFGTGWYPQGKQIALIAEENLESPNADIKYVFEKWVSTGPNPIIVPNSHSPTTTVTVNEPYEIEAHYKKSYQVNAWSQFGSPIGAGFYDEGTVAEISMSQTAIMVDPQKVRKVFTGWNTHGARVMDFSGTDPELEGAGVVPNGQNLLVFVDSPTNVTAEWKTQYFLTVQSTEGEVSGSGWYDVGRLAQISVKKPSVPPGMWSTVVFDEWTGDLESKDPNDRVVMNKPKVIIAQWREDNSPGFVNALILGGVAAVGVVIYTKTNKMAFLHKDKKKTADQKPFDQFFNLRKKKPKYDPAPAFVEKQGKGKSIMDWLLGK